MWSPRSYPFPPPSPPPTEREYRQLDQRCRAVNTSSLKRTSNSFMKLTTLATMSATVEAKTSSIINRATLRLLAPGQSILDFYGFQNQVSSTLHCDLTESCNSKTTSPWSIHTGFFTASRTKSQALSTVIPLRAKLTEAPPAVKILTFMKLQQFHSFHHQ